MVTNMGLPQGEILHVDGERQTVFLKVAEPSATEDERAIRHRAHAFAAALADGAQFDGVHVVESVIMPTTQNFYGVVPGGAWVLAVKFDDDTWPGIQTQLGSGDIAVTKRGEPMDADTIFAAAVRGKQFQDRPFPEVEATDADLVLVRQVINEALLPLLFQVRDLDSRIRRVVTGIMPPPENDPFGAAVRNPGQLTRAEEVAAAKRREQDPFGAAVLERREPLTLGQGHRYYRRDKRRR